MVEEIDNIIEICQKLQVLATSDEKSKQKKTKERLMATLKAVNQQHADFYYAVYDEHYKQASTLAGLKETIVNYAHEEGAEAAKKSALYDKKSADGIAKLLHNRDLFHDAFKEGFDDQNSGTPDPESLAPFKLAKRRKAVQ